MRTLALSLSLALFLSACGGISDADRSAMLAQIDTGLASADALDAARAAGVQAVLAAPPAATTCPLDVVLNANGTPPSIASGYLGGGNRGNYRVVEASALATAGTRSTWAHGTAESLRHLLAPGDPEPEDMVWLHGEIAALGDASHYHYDVELVRTAQIAPQVTGTTFTPGSIQGVIVVWDYVQARPVCSAPVTVTTEGTEISDTGDAARDLGATLGARFEDAALRAIGLRAS